MITINISAFLFHGLSAPLSVPPFFLKKPLDKITANESDSLTLLCLVGGTPEPEVEWFKHGAHIPFERASVFPGSRLTVTTVVPDDSGRYQCSSANSVGQLHHVFEVTIKRKNRFFLSSTNSSQHCVYTTIIWTPPRNVFPSNFCLCVACIAFWQF